MRSIFAKVLLWSLGTLILSLVAYGAIWRALERRGPSEGDPIRRIHEMVEDDLCRAYEEGGPRQLAAALRKLDSYLPGEHILTDARGCDLVSGADRSLLLRPGSRSTGPPRLPDGRLILVGPRRRGEGRYRFISIVKPWFEPPNILPYYGAVVLVIAGMGAILAMHLAAPLRRLHRVVERFGQGDLGARDHSSRGDEIGSLSRAFDEMADRIEALLASERRLLQDVSHELRSPLARLVVAVELAATSTDPSASLVRIKRDIDRLTVLVNALLQVTRAEGSPSALDAETVHLDELLRGVVEECSLEAEANGCRLELRTDQPCPVWGERELLYRAVENVIRNAIRHAPGDSVVEVLLTRHEAIATIRVRDHGPGVPEDLLGAIFKPFVRVEGHRSRASGGVGLGLAIAQRAVDLHRGRINAHDAGPGLAVTIELPLASAADAGP